MADYQPFSFVDGEGVRCSVYLSGCLFACEGCYNEAAWSFRYGEPYSRELENRVLEDLSHPAVQGLSLLGGEPFLNTQVCLALASRVRAELGYAKDIWIWSGYRLETLAADRRDKRMLLELVDVLVDGPFDLARRDASLAFRGSDNQRVIDVRASLASAEAVTWEPAGRS
ncbi:anaerobic ribonucleoside-triphosphate reductase activating protein [Demequina sp. NBRC 110056]|uniref:anaerobic ribonucleoside-triphosphate reductase activating protein n=1 Tax=Demequina sp. NBRC 110056 TaxID=1570345 RepID=UPI001F302C81|nr:anaerobic ribonucleoside-triphosphate reductase activating protein [Demequina sp. NBRC 110056]